MRKIKNSFIILFFLSAMGLAGCAGSRASLSQVPVIQWTMSAQEVVEIRLVRTNAKTTASETLSLTPEKTILTRQGKAFKPKQTDFEKDAFVRLVQMALDLEFPEVGASDDLVQELVFLKATGESQKVLLGKVLSGKTQIFYQELMTVRQKLLEEKTTRE